MTPTWHLPRRTFLRGMGACIALPFLEAMSTPLRALGAPSAFPRRMAFLYIPNGANMADWTPTATGTEFELPLILEPLKPFQTNLQVLSGLALDKARANGDGAGDHARASASFLTGCQARKTAGSNIRIGVSVDQIAAAKIGRLTRLPSLELSAERNRPTGNCDSGYACAYQFNLAWKTENTPLPPEVNPRLVFERLFGDSPAGETPEARARRLRLRKSILDFVSADAKRLSGRLGREDQHKLDEYLSAVRDIEQRIENSERFAAAASDLQPPGETPDDYQERLRVLFDMMALAFQTDSTRVATFLLAHDGSNRAYKEIGISDGHHELSHHGDDPEKKKKIAQINRFHATQLAYLLEKLKNVREGDGTLLDNCMLVYGAGIGDGNAHNHDNLPILLAGGGGGTLKPGRHLRMKKEVPLTNLYLALLDRLGVPAERVGDSTGKLEDV